MSQISTMRFQSCWLLPLALLSQCLLTGLGSQARRVRPQITQAAITMKLVSTNAKAEIEQWSEPSRTFLFLREDGRS